MCKKCSLSQEVLCFDCQRSIGKIEAALLQSAFEGTDPLTDNPHNQPVQHGTARELKSSYIMSLDSFKKRRKYWLKSQ